MLTLFLSLTRTRMPATKKKFQVDQNRLEEYIVAKGLPPKKASCTRTDGYWYLVCKSLMILKDEILNDSGGRMGYIQPVHAFPFSVHCYSETGVRLFHYLAKEQTLYCDATGTIVSMQNQSRALYYAIVLQHPHEGQSPVAVAEMITCEQSTTAVSYFLENFRRQEGIVFGFQNIVQPRTVVIDRSLVLLQSFLRVFNTESTTDYVNRCFRIVNGVAADEDFQKTFMYACVSHVMNSAKRMCHKLL